MLEIEASIIGRKYLSEKMYGIERQHALDNDKGTNLSF